VTAYIWEFVKQPLLSNDCKNHNMAYYWHSLWTVVQRSSSVFSRANCCQWFDHWKTGRVLTQQSLDQSINIQSTQSINQSMKRVTGPAEVPETNQSRGIWWLNLDWLNTKHRWKDIQRQT